MAPIITRRPDFIDVDPRIPFGIIANCNLQKLALNASSHGKRHFGIAIRAPYKVATVTPDPDPKPVKPEIFDVGFLLIPCRKVGPGGLLGRGVRVEASDLAAVHGLAQRMFEWARDAEDMQFKQVAKHE